MFNVIALGTRRPFLHRSIAHSCSDIFSHLCALQVLDLIKELCEDSKDGSTADLFDDDLYEGGDLSGLNGDLSAGYHSDSESCVMTSGNSPFISKEARYNFLSRSGRSCRNKPTKLRLFPLPG